MPDIPTDNGVPRWVVVADEALAEFYGQAKKYSPVSKLFVMENAAAHRKIGELLADRGGRSFDSRGPGRHTMTKENDPRKEEARGFAKQIATKITAAAKRGEISNFVLIAPPAFLGTLRKALGRSRGATPCLTIAREIAGRDASEVDRLLADQ